MANAFRSLPLVFLLAPGCATGPEPYGESLLGEPVYHGPGATEAQLAALEESRARWEAASASEDAIVWYGRRLAYVGRYQEAVEVFTDGLQIHPESVRLLRHRGHRWITLRRLERAIQDLSRAAARMSGPPVTEQDGVPNARNTPISTTQGNVLYQLGLARYLQGDFEGALAAYDRRVRETDRNPDNLCSTAYWRYLSLRRLGKDAAAKEAIAAISPDMDVIENTTYRDLVLLFKGERTVEQLVADAPAGERSAVLGGTLGYGLSMHQLFQGDRAGARARWRQLVSGGGASASFGVIAAEAELLRVGSPRVGER